MHGGAGAQLQGPLYLGSCPSLQGRSRGPWGSSFLGQIHCDSPARHTRKPKYFFAGILAVSVSPWAPGVIFVFKQYFIEIRFT